jgi:2-C-methyl-D-erythritol 4-phosphate cytidylyltransferase
MTVALIVAAGSGERLGADRPKALVELCGRPLVQWCIDALLDVADIERIVVALPAGAELPAGEAVADGAAAKRRVTAVEGGASRSDSVRRALAAAGAASEGVGMDLVLVHDAARPLLAASLVESVIAALARDHAADAAIAALPVTDTIKRVDPADAVLETLDRGELWAVQTPQVFRRGVLERALEVSPEELASATDDALLVERAGGRVIVVPASDENLKVTTPMDLRIAEMLVAERSGAGD